MSFLPSFHITVNKNVLSASLNKTCPSFVLPTQRPALFRKQQTPSRVQLSDLMTYTVNVRLGRPNHVDNKKLFVHRHFMVISDQVLLYVACWEAHIKSFGKVWLLFRPGKTLYTEQQIQLNQG